MLHSLDICTLDFYSAGLAVGVEQLISGAVEEEQLAIKCAASPLPPASLGCHLWGLLLTCAGVHTNCLTDTNFQLTFLDPPAHHQCHLGNRRRLSLLHRARMNNA